MMEELVEKLKKENQKELSDKIANHIQLDEQEVLMVLNSLKELNCAKEILNVVATYLDHYPKQYYVFLQFQIDALLDLKQYDEAKRKVFNELEMPYIPADFEIFLKDRLKEIEFYLQEDRYVLQVKDLNHLDQLDEAHLLVILPQLKNFNLVPYLCKIQTLLIRQDIQDITKSLLLATLSDLKINYEFAMTKDGIHYLINPIELKDLRDYSSFQYLQTLLKQKAHLLPINDYTSIQQLIETYLLYLYPKNLTSQECQHLFYGTIHVLHDLKKEQKLLKEEYEEYIQKNRVIGDSIRDGFL